MTRIISSAPTRIDLAGGTIDIWPLYLFHEGASTLNAAISLRAHVELDARLFLRGLSNRVLELGGESGTDAQPHAYPGSYVEYVERTGHEAPGVHA